MSCQLLAGQQLMLAYILFVSPILGNVSNASTYVVLFLSILFSLHISLIYYRNSILKDGWFFYKLPYKSRPQNGINRLFLKVTRQIMNTIDLTYASKPHSFNEWLPKKYKRCWRILSHVLHILVVIYIFPELDFLYAVFINIF